MEPVIYIYEECTSNNYKKLQQILLSYNEVVGAGAPFTVKCGPKLQLKAGSSLKCFSR
jgi:hypothetical protein